MTPTTDTTTPGIIWPYTAVKPAVTPEATLNNFATTMYDWGKAESGLTSNNFPSTAPTRKRTRSRSFYDEPGGRLLDEEIINSHIQQQQSEMDRFIAIHGEDEDRNGDTEEEGIGDVGKGNRGKSGEEIERKRRRNRKNGEIELGIARESETAVYGESSMEGFGREQ
ncbi:E3 ubiquitin-protein ligase BOI-like [Cucumis melo var. makuwa]|uniref:E3 ubiquitin-protein ligase BOI-like n=1 Tax=Cucumis melo var. makuwa TaxID=1194695 RepID=A0A5D3DZL1_CUCMM|nr:E3 ubiquitin-protein ligase BOI-like [Cucumis melo var. makuwa]